jgi:DNA-binding GntR family transcriptional regulator
MPTLLSLVMAVNSRQATDGLRPLEAPATLTDSTADALRERILAGGFAPAERLVEVEIARQLGISRGPVREALARLREEGLVRDVARRGWFVEELTPDDLRELYELRSALEARAARLIIQRGDDAALDTLAGLVDELRDAAARGDREAFAQLDLDFHESIARLSGNRRLHRAFVQQAGVLRTLLRLEMATIYETLDGILAEHEWLLGELRSGSVERAEAACEVHLGQALERVTSMRRSME